MDFCFTHGGKLAARDESLDFGKIALVLMRMLMRMVVVMMMPVVMAVIMVVFVMMSVRMVVVVSTI